MSHDYKNEIERTKEKIEELEGTSFAVSEAIENIRHLFKNKTQFSPKSFPDCDLVDEWRRSDEEYEILYAYEEVSKSFDEVLVSHYELLTVIQNRIDEEETQLSQLSEWYREEMEDKLRQGEVL